MNNHSSDSSSWVLYSEQVESLLSKFELKVFVYDYDRGFLSDDLIGYGEIDLKSLKENVYVSSTIPYIFIVRKEPND